MRSLFAFIMSPFISIIVFLVVMTVFLTLSAGGNIAIYFRYLQMGFGIFLLVYLYLFMIGMPVFLIVRFIWGWNLWSCLLSAGVAYIILMLIFLANSNQIDYDDFKYFSVGKILFTTIVSAIAYGLAFWIFGFKKRMPDNV